ncbi:unnamed protein product, partial [Chrysoparadoxa australica]
VRRIGTEKENSESRKEAAKQVLGLMEAMEKTMKNGKIEVGFDALDKKGWVGVFCDPRMKAMGTVQLETDQQKIKKWVLDEAVLIGKVRRAEELASLAKLIARAKEQERVQEEQGEKEVQDSQEPAKSPSGPNLFKEMANKINLTRPVINPSRFAVAVGCQ